MAKESAAWVNVVIEVSVISISVTATIVRIIILSRSRIVSGQNALPDKKFCDHRARESK
jgi:hypothetical protein